MWWLTLAVIRRVFVISAALGVILAGVHLVSPYEYPDPFAPYKPMMPGQIIPLADTHIPCDRRAAFRPSIPIIVCTAYPTDGIFVMVEATLVGDKVSSTHFIARELYVGDLVRHLGQPDAIERKGSDFVLVWDKHVLAAHIEPATTANQLTNLTPIASLDFVAHVLP